LNKERHCKIWATRDAKWYLIEVMNIFVVCVNHKIKSTKHTTDNYSKNIFMQFHGTDNWLFHVRWSSLLSQTLFISLETSKMWPQRLFQIISFSQTNTALYTTVAPISLYLEYVDTSAMCTRHLLPSILAWGY